jgi:hypothetical protein
MALDPARAAVALGDELIFLEELRGGGLEEPLCLQQSGAGLATQQDIPVLDDFLRQGQTVLLGGFLVFFALRERRTMPVVAATPFAEVDVAAQNCVRPGSHDWIVGTGSSGKSLR